MPGPALFIYCLHYVFSWYLPPRCQLEASLFQKALEASLFQKNLEFIFQSFVSIDAAMIKNHTSTFRIGLHCCNKECAHVKTMRRLKRVAAVPQKHTDPCCFSHV